MSTRKNLIVASICGGAAVLLLWIVADENSPLVHRFAPNPVPLRDVWASLHFHIYLIMIAFHIRDQSGHIFFYSLVFVQWFLVAYLAVWMWKRRR